MSCLGHNLSFNGTYIFILTCLERLKKLMCQNRQIRHPKIVENDEFQRFFNIRKHLLTNRCFSSKNCIFQSPSFYTFNNNGRTVIEMDSVNRRQDQWKLAIIMGIINIVIGVLLVIFKRDSLKVILIISGVLLIIEGALVLFAGINVKDIIPIVFGGVLVAIGIAMVILPSLFADIFMVLLAILFIFLGISGAMSTFEKPENGPLGIIFSIAIAALMIAAGIIILFNLNTSADWVMIVTGVMMIVSGALNVIGGALEFKRLR